MFGRSKRNDKTIVLTTSNGSLKYVSDAIQAVSLPRGWVMHFRYELKLVDSGLAKDLPQVRRAKNNGVKERRVLLAYVFQSRQPSGSRDLQPVAAHPLRYARMVDAYRTGTRDQDVAHFYFKLEQYWVPQSSTPHIDEIMNMLKTGHYAGQISPTTASSEDGESAALAVLDDIPNGHFSHQPPPDFKDRQYYPLLVHVRGVQKRKGWRRDLRPQFQDSDGESSYNLTERGEYLVNFSFHVPNAIGKSFGAPQPGSTIGLNYAPESFASEANRSLAVESRYDEQLWLVVPSATDRTTLRELRLVTALKVATPDRVDAIDLRLKIPVAIEPDRLRRLGIVGLTIAADVSFAVATIIVAFAKSVAVTPGQPTGPFGIPSDTFNLAVALYVFTAVARVIAGLAKP